MKLVRRLLRSLYRKVFEAPLWRFLAKVKMFFFADTNNRLQNLESFQRESTERLVREEIERIQKDNLQRIYLERHQTSAPVGVGWLSAPYQPLSDQRLIVIEQRLQGFEANIAAQWDALEQLILAVLRPPDVHTSVRDEEPSDIR